MKPWSGRKERLSRTDERRAGASQPWGQPEVGTRRDPRPTRKDRRPLLSVTGLVKRFGAHTVLEGFELQVGVGEVVALVGENGAGKTTAVKCIAGVLAPDAGDVWLRGGDGGRRGLAVVWQDLALCDNLDVIGNIFLGREAALVGEEAMEAEARHALTGLGIDLGDLRRSVDTLSGGERQLVAVARAMLARPPLLVLDEPTAALGVATSRLVTELIGDLRATGTAVLLASHRSEEVFDLADRIVVLRRGRVVATVAPREAHPDDVAALMSGTEVDSTARRQLQRLRSLGGQLSGVEPSASLPLIVSSAADALGVDQLCLHLLDREPGEGKDPVLHRSAAVGLPAALLAVNGHLPVGRRGGPVGLAAETEDLVVVEDARADPVWEPYGVETVAAGVKSAWAAPIVGSRGVLGVLSGYTAAPGRPQADQLELVSLYASHAAAAIERSRLFGEVTRRNRVLESLRAVLETLAGPDPLHGGLNVGLLALCRGLGAEAAALYVEEDGRLTTRAAIDLRSVVGIGTAAEPELRRAALALTANPGMLQGARLVGEDVLGVGLTLPEGRAVLAAIWQPPAEPTQEARELLEDGARSLCLALEREELEAAHQETAALRRSHTIQREFLSRLSHELRTPLTAIHGHASSLRQADVRWDAESQDRFLTAIATESARMSRLVADLLDSSALESGVLRLHCDWCDLHLLLASALICVGQGNSVELWCDPGLGTVWGDHDRLEQVFVNLIDNAVRHTPVGTPVQVRASPGTSQGTVAVRIVDHGPGIPPGEVERLFQPYARGHTHEPGAGLGLSIARGIVAAHGGSVTLEPVHSGTSFLVTLPVEPPSPPAADGATHMADEVGVWEAGG
jgi:signal transduction histidine kinase/ABC-type multidrug transport system ATPase subunit